MGGLSNSEAMYEAYQNADGRTLTSTAATDGSIQTLQPLSSEIHHIFNPSQNSNANSVALSSTDEIYDNPNLKLAQISSTALSNIIKSMKEMDPSTDNLLSNETI